MESHRNQAVSWFLLAMLIFTGSSLVNLERLHAAPAVEMGQDGRAISMLSINAASAEELEQLRGIGPAIAQRIIDYRQQNGEFQSIEDLLNVRGVGSATLAKIKNQISV